MKVSLIVSILLFLFSTSIAHAEKVETIDGVNCNHGVNKQPKGLFAVYVFCDDALGTNIAVFMDHIGAPLAGKYFLGKRFWQGEEWNYDVTSFSWLRDNQLLLATSAIYGSGKIYKLDLENQKFSVIKDSIRGICLMHLKSVKNKKVKIVLTDCETLKEEIIEIAL